MRKKVEAEAVDTLRRTGMVVAAAIIMAVNLKTFVRAGGLIPGGFTGLTRLLQEIGVMLWGVEPPYTVINVTLNAIPVFIGFKFIGKKFTGYSCLMILVSSIATDLFPGFAVTTDTLLVAVFGGLFNAVAIAVCLMAGASSGGTDFIAIFLSEKWDMDSWNYVFAFNVIILGVAGALFSWEKALYSIIFQFTSTQVLHSLHRRYQKQTLLIITRKPQEVYETIRELTNHDATLIKGEGCYMKKECNILYSVVGRDEVRRVLKHVRETDPEAFVNMIRTDSLSGRFYQRPND